jgi:hypothetical protein
VFHRKLRSARALWQALHHSISCRFAEPVDAEARLVELYPPVVAAAGQGRTILGVPQKIHFEKWLNYLILLVPPVGIEPTPDDYKS